MKKLFLFVLLFFGLFMYAQKIRFDYDAAGNQIQRKWCPGCFSKNAQEPVKEFSKVEDSDLQKFFPEDVISYYPNPVKEQLYLKWELINNNEVTRIDIYSLNGQLLRSFQEIDKSNSMILSFSEYPNGVVLVNLVYKDGDQKSIKIIKE